MKAHAAWMLTLLSIGALIAPAGVGARGTDGSQQGHSRVHLSTRCPQRYPAHGTVTFTTTLSGFPDTLNPDQTIVPASAYLDPLLQSSLIRLDSQGRPHPEMLARLPTVANGDVLNHGRTVILRLKHGLRWSNGTEITSADVRFGWKIDMDAGSGPNCAGSCDGISGIATPDRYTAVLHLRRPDPALPTVDLPEDIWPTRWPGAWNNNAHQAALELYQVTGFDFTGPEYPTDGPYQVTRVVPGVAATLHPMRYYDVMNCGAHVRTVRFVANDGNPAHVAQAIGAKTWDFAVLNLQDLTVARAVPRVRTRLLGISYVEHLELDHAPTFQGASNPLAHTDVRLALALAIDKPGLVQHAYGVNATTARRLAVSAIVPNTPFFHLPSADRQLQGQWDPLARSYVEPGTARALADARALLAREGYPNGFQLQLTTSDLPVRQIEAGAVAADWARIGVQTRVRVLPNVLSIPFGGGDFQAGLWALNVAPVDPFAFRKLLTSGCANPVRPFHQPPQCTSNFSLIRDPVLDRSFAALANAQNPAVIHRAFNRVQVEINRQAHWVPLYFRGNVLADDGRVRHLNEDVGTAYAWTVR